VGEGARDKGYTICSPLGSGYFFCFVLGSITSLYVICLLLLFGSLRDWFDGELMFFVILAEVRRLPPFLPDYNHVPYSPLPKQLPLDFLPLGPAMYVGRDVGVY
jgi:hypothetical protein